MTNSAGIMSYKLQFSITISVNVRLYFYDKTYMTG